MSKTKNCHFIPQTYLKSWAYNNNIKIYDKTNKVEILNGFSISNHFCKKNLYNFKFEMLTYVREFPLIYSDFKKMIKNFIKENNIDVFYKKVKFDIKNQNLGCLLEKDNIDFYENGKIVGKNKKNNLYNKLNQLKSTVLEDEFNKLIENNWTNFLEHLLTKPSLKGISEYIYLNADEMLLLRLMVVSLLLRIEETPGLIVVDKTIDDVFSMVINALPVQDFKDEFNSFLNNDVKYLLFLKNIYNLLMYKDKSKFMRLTFDHAKLNFELYIINNKNDEFYTSDVPCFEVLNNFESTNANNGIYLPLSPKLLVILRRDTELSNTINVFNASSERVKYFNCMIYNHCNQYIIFKDKF